MKPGNRRQHRTVLILAGDTTMYKPLYSLTDERGAL